MQKLTFIGAGNMASSIIGGLLAKGYSADQIYASAPGASLQRLATAYRIKTTTDNRIAIEHADVIVLAVKPQIMRQVTVPLSEMLTTRKPLIISVAAGVTLAQLANWLGDHLPIVRCVPNTPALIQAGMTVLFGNELVTPEQHRIVNGMFDAVGNSLWVDCEQQLDAATAVSGSGPAYFFLMMEAMKNAGVALGLEANIAKTLTLQTALGAARMAIDSDVDVDELRRRVTSPGGTTEQAIKTLQQGDFSLLFEQALNAAARRSSELAREI